jgi:hypothetical protein
VVAQVQDWDLSDRPTLQVPQECWHLNIFLTFRIVGGGVQLGPLGTAATDWPNVPAPGDYDDEEFG